MSDHHLQRSLLIRAERGTVFSFFVDSDLFAAWWGSGSTIDGRPGGAVRIVYPNGATASGAVVAMEPHDRIVFTFGYEDDSKPIPPGGSTVTITLEDHPFGTLLHLDHAFDDEATRDMHVPGWRYQLAVFANVVARQQHREIDSLMDRYFALWAERDEPRRKAALQEILTSGISFRDAYACVEGQDEFNAHVSAAQQHGPVGAIERDGPARQCQGTAVVDWLVRGPDGHPALRGANVVELAPDGRIASIVGLWTPPG